MIHSAAVTAVTPFTESAETGPALHAYDAAEDIL